jgi:REP-associated tyrosine transposase
MARSPRITIPAYPHHIIQRGNNRSATSLPMMATRLFGMSSPSQNQMSIQDLRVLMTNHFHLLVEPAKIGDLDRFMQSAGRRYVRYINETADRSRTLWDGRLKTAPVSRDEYLSACSRYIELNPLRAGLVEHPKDYRWSSYQRCGLGVSDRLLDDDPWYTGLGTTEQERQEEYRQWTDSQVNQANGTKSDRQRNAVAWSEKNLSKTDRRNDLTTISR